MGRSTITDTEYEDAIWLSKNTRNTVGYFEEISEVLKKDNNESIATFWTAYHNLSNDLDMDRRKQTSLQSILSVSTAMIKLDKKIRAAINSTDTQLLLRLFDERSLLNTKLINEYVRFRKYVNSLGSRI